MTNLNWKYTKTDGTPRLTADDGFHTYRIEKGDSVLREVHNLYVDDKPRSQIVNQSVARLMNLSNEISETAKQMREVQ